MTLTGRSLIGAAQGATGSDTFQAVNPATGAAFEPAFTAATDLEIDRAAQLAEDAFAAFAATSGQERGAFLRLIASRIEERKDEIIARANVETALPIARLTGEVGRTAGQLRLFAGVIEEGSWVTARLDTADPARTPAPKPDLRSMLRPIGPVVVFGASNFPLAFSVAGGDTASALAAGNPVIVKAHPAHPGTSELVGRIIQECVTECSLPEGVFSLLFDSGIRVGSALVRHPLVRAVAFTGSLAGGKALMDLAAARPEPIPIYAEMSSTNPVVIMPDAVREGGSAIAKGLFGSVTLGTGQFCTKPGLVFLQAGEDGDRFVEELSALVTGAPDMTTLTGGIRAHFVDEGNRRAERGGVEVLAKSEASLSGDGFTVGAALFQTDAATYAGNPDLGHELFGPATLVVRYHNQADLLSLAKDLEGHLTATVHGTDADIAAASELVAVLERKAGRLVFNGYPTGVEVGHAMVHGGPYPSTSDGRSTSVGSQAIFRFARPVCYQDSPQSLLPDALKDGNPLGIWRMKDGEMGRT